MNSVDRTHPPPFRLSSNYTLAQPEVLHFQGGQPLFTYRNIQQRVVRLELVFQAGKWFESKSGVSYFTTQLLRKGTRTRSAFQIASALDELGAHLEATASFDTVTVTLLVLSKQLSRALPILLEIISEPAFEEAELQQEKDIFIQNLRVNNEKTNIVASREIRRAVFGGRHPYGNSTEESDVHSISTADLKQCFLDRFKLDSAYLVGPLSDVELNSLIDAFPLTRPAMRVIDLPAIQPGASLRIEKPGSVQASIRLGKRCITKRDSPDYFDAVMANHLLGGFFGSRLMKTIREEKGLTYGIHSSMNHFRHASFWVISAEVNQQNAQQAIDEIHHEILKLQEGVSIDELEVARNYFVGSWQSDNATLFAVSDKVRNLHEFHLPSDYYSHLLDHLMRMTPEQVQRAAREHFGSENLLEVRVG